MESLPAGVTITTSGSCSNAPVTNYGPCTIKTDAPEGFHTTMPINRPYGLQDFYTIGLGSSHSSLEAANSQTTASISLPQTGQTPTSPLPAIPGMDGYTYFGVPWAYNPNGLLVPLSRFTVGTDAQSDCITDNLTGLMWARSSSDTTYTWDNAIKSTESGGAVPKSLCGYTDWRLPNKNELKSLINWGVDLKNATEATWLQSQGVINVQPEDYWTSSIRVISI